MDILHLKSPENWINDPNGFVYFKGKYHLFYQHFPYEPIWGTMHWGHAVSEDLVHWEHQGIAIYPSKSYDQNGVFSGNALIKDEKLYLYYTGICYPNPNPEYIHLDSAYGLIASQVLMISEDGEHFDNRNQKSCVIAPSTDQEKMSSVDTRDPKVFENNGEYIMILGSAHKGRGRIIFLKSPDAISFEQISSYESEEFGTIFECPDLFALEGKQVLFCAATDYIKDGLTYQAQEIYKFVNFDEKSCSLTWERESHYLDYGMDLYATQTNLDRDHNRVLIAWMRMPVPKTNKKGKVFSGLMTMPRVLSVKNDHLYFTPHPNVEALFTKKVTKEEVQVENAGAWEILAMERDDNFEGESTLYGLNEKPYVKGNRSPYKISVELLEGTSINIAGYVIEYEKGILRTDRTAVYPEGDYRYRFEMPKLTDGTHLDIYVDEDIIEIFANKGEYVLSNIIYMP